MRFSIYALAGSISLTAASTDCCSDLHSALSSKVVFPDSASYNSSEASYFAAQESTLRPSCVLYPSTSEDVSTAVKILAKNSQCKFAIKGGGHNPNSGYANVQDGVTINFSNMAGVEVDGSGVKVGAGARWLSVYKALEPLGLAVAGGRNGNVGVGGLLLGGGISHFTTRVGWACDNVINYEVVLPSGRIVQANAASNADLFHALCGGGNNFGIVTRFDLKSFQQGDISVTKLVNDISVRQQVFEAFTDIVTSSTFDPETSLVTSLIFNSTSKSWVLSSSAVYTKPETKPEVFQQLASVPNIVNQTTITSLASFADEEPITSTNVEFATMTFKASAQFMGELFNELNSTLHIVDVPGVLWVVALEPLAGRMLTTGKTLGMQQNEAGYVVLLSPIWSDTSAARAVNRLTKQFTSRAEHSARKLSLLQPFQYANYAAEDQRPLESYGHERLAQLREVSHKYDPLQVMQKQVKGYKICY